MLPVSLAGLTGEGLSLLKPLRPEEVAISSNTQDTKASYKENEESGKYDSTKGRE